MGSISRIGVLVLLVASGVVAGADRSAGSATATPRIAFESSRGCAGIQSGYGGLDAGDIYTALPDGSGLLQVTSDCYSSDPAWSPAGDRIALVSTRDGSPAVYVMDATGGGLQRISPPGLFAWQPAWSRLGEIAFAVDLPVAERGIWVMRADGAAASHITGYGERPAWSPAGDRIVFDDPQHDAVLVMNPDGTNIRQIGTGRGAAYAPTGDRIAWTASATSGTDAITIANDDGTSPRVIYTAPTYDFRVAWSPDADALAFAQGLSSPDLYEIAASGGPATRLTANAAIDTDPDWQPVVPSTGLVLQQIIFPRRACATRPTTGSLSVADAQGRPLPGVSVVIRGGAATVRAVTNAAGRADAQGPFDSTPSRQADTHRQRGARGPPQQHQAGLTAALRVTQGSVSVGSEARPTREPGEARPDTLEWQIANRGLASFPLLASSRCLRWSGRDEGSPVSMPDSASGDDRVRQAVEISNQLTRSHRESFGRGASNVKTVIQKGFVVTFLEDVYTPFEKTMIGGGHEKLVMEARFAFQQMKRDDYRKIVETVTGRKVRAFLSQNHIDPPIAVEMFVLESEAGDEASDVQAN